MKTTLLVCALLLAGCGAATDDDGGTGGTAGVGTTTDGGTTDGGTSTGGGTTADVAGPACLDCEWFRQSTGISDTLTDIWGSDSSHILVVGEKNSVLRFDGENWESLDSGMDAGVDWFAVWGSGAQHTWLAGANGKIAFYDGDTFVAQDSSTDAQLMSICGSGPESVWAGTADGQLLRFDGTDWTAEKSDLGPMSRVYMLEDQFGFAVGTGEDGTFLMQHSESGWGQAEVPDFQGQLEAVWGLTANDFWAVGGELDGTAMAALKYDGTAWKVMDVPMPMGEDTRAFGADVWASQADDVWFATGTKNRILHFDGQAFTWVTTHDETPEPLTDVWAAATDDAWAVGPSGQVFHWTTPDE